MEARHVRLHSVAQASCACQPGGSPHHAGEDACSTRAAATLCQPPARKCAPGATRPLTTAPQRLHSLKADRSPDIVFHGENSMSTQSNRREFLQAGAAL